MEIRTKATEYLNAAMQELGIAKASDITVEVVTTDADSSKRIVETLQEQWQNALGINSQDPSGNIC